MQCVERRDKLLSCQELGTFTNQNQDHLGILTKETLSILMLPLVCYYQSNRHWRLLFLHRVHPYQVTLSHLVNNNTRQHGCPHQTGPPYTWIQVQFLELPSMRLISFLSRNTLPSHQHWSYLFYTWTTSDLLFWLCRLIVVGVWGKGYAAARCWVLPTNRNWYLRVGICHICILSHANRHQKLYKRSKMPPLVTGLADIYQGV